MRIGKRACCIALAAVLLSLASSIAAQAPQWTTFTFAADGFQALFPSAPEAIKNAVPAGADSYELRSYAVEVGSTALYVGVLDFGARGRTANPATLLVNAEKGAVEHVGAHILSEKTITVDAGPAQAASIPGIALEAANDKMDFTIRMYIADGVLYQVMVASPLSEKFAGTTRFLGSFRLLLRQ